VGVAVERDADVRAELADARLQALWVERAAAAVDVLAVGLAGERVDARAELLDDLGRDAVAGAVRCVDHDAEAVERERAREAVLDEDVVAPERVVDAEGLSDLPRRRPEVVDRVREDELLDLGLDGVRQLEAVRREELDAVVLE